MQNDLSMVFRLCGAALLPVWCDCLNSLTFIRHPLFQSLGDVNRQPCPLGLWVYSSGIYIPMRGTCNTMRFQNLEKERTEDAVIDLKPFETEQFLFTKTSEISFWYPAASCVFYRINSACIQTVEWIHLVYFHSLLRGSCMCVLHPVYAKLCLDKCRIPVYTGNVKLHHSEVWTLRHCVYHVCGNNRSTLLKSWWFFRTFTSR